MASDDESTQPIDIEALRSASMAKGAAKRPEREAEEVFATDEHTAMTGMDETGEGELAPFDLEIPGIPDGPTSVTRIDGPDTPEDMGAVTVAAPSTPHPQGAVSMPGTLPAHELVQALVEVMGAAQSSASSPATEASGPPTASRLAFPSAWEDVEVTSVSAPRSRVAPSSTPDEPILSSNGPGPASSPVSTRPEDDAPLPRFRDVSFPGELEATSDAVASSDAPHPADAEDDTRMGRLDQAEVRAVFAAAESGEQTAILQIPLATPQRVAPSPQSEPSIVDIDSMELDAEDAEDAELAEDAEVAELARTSDDLGDSSVNRAALRVAHDDADALPRFSLASMDDLQHELAPQDETRVRAPSHPPTERRASDPAVSYRTSEPAITEGRSEPQGEPEIVLSVNEADIELLSDSVESVALATNPAGDSPPFELSPQQLDDDEVSYDDEGGATLYLRREPAANVDKPARADETRVAPPKRASMAPPAVAYQPPAPVGRPASPAYENDTDEDEDQLQREGSFGALLDLHRLRVADADTPTARAALLHKIGSIHEYKMGDLEAAFPALLEAFELRPGDDDIVASLERVAKATGRVGELAERARRTLHTADSELRVILLGHLVYWYERVLGRSHEMSPFVSEIERVDKTHPVALRRAAQHAAANGDIKVQRELLQRALDRTSRRDEKVHLHIALASAHAGTPEASKHYESAVANDASSVVALQGLERLGREQGKHAQVEWCLERQVEVALTPAERIDALVKLAELHERKYLKRERAAEILERVVALEPSHPQALKALERCYHALRDWPRLAKVLRLRAVNTYDKAAKTELLQLAAEVLDAKLGDAAAAIEVHRDLLVVDPTHRRALADLARLYEKLGDWGNMATYKARVAELSSTKRQASQLLVQLGDFLSAPDRDDIAARLQYERAVTVDPSNASAWEALQRLATASGDDRRVAECLEQRARHVDSPRQRASIFVELANLHLGNGADRAAREAFEQAVGADPTNELAAAAMLDVYSREEKWTDAAPLCDLLVNAARRDGDSDALFTRLRLATRIAAALGDPERAMTAALAALDIHPEDEGARADLVAICSQCREQPRVVSRAKDWLTRIAAGPTVLPAPVLMGLALIQKQAGEVDLVASTLERARDAEPDNLDVLQALADAYLAQGDYPRCCKLMVDMARNATTADARFKLLCEAGEIWARKADELDKAATVFEEARLIKPLDHWLLHTLLSLYSERQRWDELSSVLEGITQIHESPEKKAKSLFAMAQVVEEKLGDLGRAADLFDQVLDIDKKRLDAFEQLVRVLTEAKDWAGLERSYRKMIGRIKDDPTVSANLRFALFHQLGLIYRDRLEDAELAYEALEAAARLRPDDAAVRKIVTELLVVTDNLDNAVVRTRELIARDPHDAELYSELYDLFLRQRAFDKAWCAVNVLAQMREPAAEQARFHSDYAPMQLSQIPGQLVEKAWHSHVMHAELDPKLTALFSRMTPAVARMRHGQLRPEQLVHAVGRPFTGQHSRLYDAVRRTFTNAAEILHMTPPELLLGDPSSPVPFAAALAPFGAVHVGVQAVEARADALIYVIGKRLAEQRPELVARAFFPSVSDLTALLAAAVRVSRQEGAHDPASRALDASLSAVLMPQERESMRQVVLQAQLSSALVDVKRWSQVADLSSMRAGLLLSGDVGPARRTILAEPQSTADLPPREKIGELYKFATSDLYSDLRGAIGVAVQE